VFASARFPNGAIVLGATRTNGQADSSSSVFFLDPLSLNVIDSLTPNDLGTETNVLEQVVPTLTGDLLFLRTRTTLKRFDNQSRATTAEIAAPTLGSLRLSLDETNLLLTDP
jgi:hypothetical protein